MNINVLVDVQTNFVAASETDYLGRVVAETQEAMRRDEWIVVILCDRCGGLHTCIAEALTGYDKVAYVTKPKQAWDGSMQVMWELKRLHLTPASFTVWGLYSDQCVFATVAGLLTEFSCPVTIKKDACLACVRMDWNIYARCSLVTVS